jgi:hypothetical protein
MVPASDTTLSAAASQLKTITGVEAAKQKSRCEGAAGLVVHSPDGRSDYFVSAGGVVGWAGAGSAGGVVDESDDTAFLASS